MIQRYKAEFFSLQYWSNHGAQPDQKSGPDCYYAIISNILQKSFTETSFGLSDIALN